METKELAGCVIYNEQGELLLIHRNTPTLIQWEMPGGKLEEGETLKEAAIREIKEETGLDVAITNQLGNASFEHKGINWSYTWFEAQPKDLSSLSIAEPHYFDDVRFWNVGDLAKRGDLSPNVINLLKVL